ncbi:MAG TPA: GDSL-type esterase/lipase family protein, partial [Spirochaetota bacterium]|nr:GDSL-type esterase/lipase family protein [Spirochaetota bacterium]
FLLLFLSFAVIVFIHISITFYKDIKWARFNPAKLDYYSQDNIKITSAEKKKARVLFFGDSRICQWENLPDINNCETINRGIGGETTAGALLRIEKDVLELKPDITVIQLGINDLTTIGLLPDRYGFIKQTCIKNLERIIDTLTLKKVNVVVLTVIPNSEVSLVRRLFWSDEIEEAIRDVNSRIVNMENDFVHVIKCDEIFHDKNNIKSEYYKDTLHINQKGYGELNMILKPVLNDFINKRRI